MVTRGCAVLLMLCLASGLSAVAQEWEVWPRDTQVSDHPKIANFLENLIADYQASRSVIALDTMRRVPSFYGLHREGDRVRVVIEIESANLASRVVSALKSIGGEIELSYDTQIQALVPIKNIRQIAEVKEVQFVRPPIQPVLMQGATVSEGQKLIGAPTWHTAGVNGQGVKVGLIDPAFYRYEQLLGRELPPRERVTARSFRSDGRMYDPDAPSSHGVAVSEVVTDVAPGINLYLAAFDTDVEFRRAVDWLIEQKVDVINTSLGFPSGCFRGQGMFEPSIRKAREAGITWVTSAGNRGDSHWEGSFTDPNTNDRHNFSSFDETLTFEVELFPLEVSGQRVAGVLVVFFLSWDAPCSGAFDDYDLAIFPESAPEVRLQGDWAWRRGVPVKVAGGLFYTRNPALAGRRDSFAVEITKKRSGAAPARLDLVAQVCLICHSFEYLVPQGSISIFEPAISPNAISVGAFHHAPDRCPSDLCPETNLFVYSSRGPTKDGRIKPDITAPSHISTATYGKYTGDGPNQNSGFDGTSASAPHVAGAAALVKQVFPKFTPQQVQEFLEKRAEDRGARGKDNDWGAGQLLLGEVIIIPNAPADLVAFGSGPREISVTWKDQATNEAGFSLERRFARDPDFSEIARLGPDATTFTDTNVLPETPYCYRVRAFTSSGQSDYSNESCATGSLELALYEFSAELQQGAFARIEIPGEIKSALPVGVRFVEEPNVTLRDRTSRSLSEINLQLSPSTGSIFGSPNASGEFPFLIAVFSNGHKLARIWVLLTVKPALALVRRTAQTQNPPEILFIDFPSQIRATGKPIMGFVGFKDPDGDLTKASFTVVSATDFQSFEVTPNVKGQKEGVFSFEIATTIAQNVTLAVTLTDEAGQASQAVEFSFEAVPVPILRVTPESLNAQGMAGVGEIAAQELEITNGGSGTLAWTALTDAAWLKISPDAGEVAAGGSVRATVKADNTALSAGRHRALIMIRAPGAENSPQWVRFGLELAPAGGTLLWKTSVGATDSSPALGADGMIYLFGADQSLYALSADGQVQWTFKAGGNILSASVAIAKDKTIYFGADDGNLYALAPDGKEKWRFAANLPVRSSPAIGPDGTIYIGSGSQPSEDAKVYAIQPNGTVKGRPFDVEGGVVSSPALSAKTLYVGALDRRVYAVNLDGFYRQWRLRLGDSIHSSPAIGADGTLYIGADDGNLYALAPDGKERWRFQTNDGIFSSPAIGSDGTIYVGSLDGRLYAISPEGKEKWRFQTEGPIYSSPAIAADGVVYIGSDDGNLYAVNADGTRRWSFKTAGPVRSSPVIENDGRVYITSRDGNLYAIRGEAGPAQSPWPMFRQNPQRTGAKP
ncbi:MAG: PQQ-binding-like beta-propeller repeat protein [Candidatus Bipolaricaulota bacterium]|nr:PQQ-binding-like beta-propeller repeat protein [Candidatus Bipolaricaulota bacterium]